MNFENDEKSGYGLELELLTIWYWLCVSYRSRSGIVGKSNH